MQIPWVKSSRDSQGIWLIKIRLIKSTKRFSMRTLMRLGKMKKILENLKGHWKMKTKSSRLQSEILNQCKTESFRSENCWLTWLSTTWLKKRGKWIWRSFWQHWISNRNKNGMKCLRLKTLEFSLTWSKQMFLQSQI